MKRLLLYFTIVAFAFAACEPMEDRDSFTNVKVNESDLEVSATAVEVDGKNSNEVVVENNSPMLSRWISDRNQIESAYGTVAFDTIGNRDVKFVGLNGDGSQVATTLPVTIDTITSLPDDVISRMGIEFNDCLLYTSPSPRDS